MSTTTSLPARPRAWSSRRAVSALGLMSLVGGLLFTVSAPAGAAYPGDYGRIAFESDRGLGGDMDIWTVNPDGSGLMQITANFAEDVDPAWSANGSKLAFASNRDGDYDIYTVNANGTGLTQVTTAAGDQFNPVWSPNGATIGFDTLSGVLGVFGVISTTLSAGGGPLPELSDGGGFLSLLSDLQPAISPNGSTVAFTRDDLIGPASDIFTISSAGPPGSEAVVPLGFGLVDSAPDWSPNGTRLVIERVPGISVINATTGAELADLPFSLGGGNPVYSPDGTLIAFDLLGDITTRLADGTSSGLGFVTSGPDLDLDPSWQPTDFPAPPGPIVLPPAPGFNRLSVVRTGTGTGTVTSSPAGVSCGSDCIEDYATGTAVTLTATPTGGSTLGGWNVAGCSGLSCVVTMNADTTVNPVFNAPAAAAAAAPGLDPRCGQVGVICGDNGHNILIGTPGPDLILGFGGDDNCQGLGGDDVIICSAGNDILRGGPGNDTLISTSGRDHMRGGPGNDTLKGGAGRDRLIGGAGHDDCDDGPGKDLVRGCEL